MDILARGAAQLGVELAAHQLDRFEVYFRELSDWSRRMNLTAITGYEEVQVKHFVDSLTVCLALPGGPAAGSRLVDVGAGAGFPGLPLKLAFPHIRLALVESVGKKARFLEHLLAALDISGAEVLNGRAEELAHRTELREGFDLAVSRGVASLPVLLEYTLPFCRPGGRVVLLKQGGVREELAGAGHALELLGGGPGQVVPVEVDGLADGRVVAVVPKVRATPSRFPRRPGIPAKRPL